MGGSSIARADTPTGGPTQVDRAGFRLRRLVLRFAFVGSAASGLVLAAGAAAHADLPDPTSVVSPTVDATASSTDVSVVTTDVVSSATAAADTIRETGGSVTRTVGEATDPITKTVGDVADTVTKTTEDVVDAIGTTVDDPIDPVRTVLDEEVVGIGSDALGNGIAVRSGSVAIRTDAVQEGRRPATAPLASDVVAGTSLLPSTGTSAGASAPSADREPSFPSPLSPPLRDSSSPWPVEPLTAGFTLALIAVIALRSPSAPPTGWLSRLLRTTAFHGAAVALAVERPG